MDYAELKSIDEFELVEEWKQQYDLRKEVNEALDSLLDQQELVKDRMDFIAAGFRNKARSGEVSGLPEGRGGVINEGTIQDALIRNKKYRKVFKEHQALERRIRRLKNLSSTLNQRNDALRYMVKLYLSDYYAEPGNEATLGALKSKQAVRGTERHRQELNEPKKKKKKKKRGTDN